MNEIENLKRAIENMEILLDLPSGATQFQLRSAAYYAAATWFLPKFKKFAYLVLYGDVPTTSRTECYLSLITMLQGMYCLCDTMLSINAVLVSSVCRVRLPVSAD